MSDLVSKDTDNLETTPPETTQVETPPEQSGVAWEQARDNIFERLDGLEKSRMEPDMPDDATDESKPPQEPAATNTEPTTTPARSEPPSRSSDPFISERTPRRGHALFKRFGGR